MRLTRHTDYALRLLTYLGVKDGGRATIREIAQSNGISRSHLMKVAHELGRHGFVDTARGKQGGLSLARPPERIGLGDVVRRCEPDLAIVECFEPEQCNCRIAPACALQSVLHDALDAFLTVLDRHTLADLLGPRPVLAELLALDRTSA